MDNVTGVVDNFIFKAIETYETVQMLRQINFIDIFLFDF